MDKKCAFISQTRTFLSDPKLLSGGENVEEVGAQAGSLSHPMALWNEMCVFFANFNRTFVV